MPEISFTRIKSLHGYTHTKEEYNLYVLSKQPQLFADFCLFSNCFDSFDLLMKV